MQAPILSRCVTSSKDAGIQGVVANAGAGEGEQQPSSSRYGQGGKQTMLGVPWTMHLYDGTLWQGGRKRENESRVDSNRRGP